MSKIQSQGFFPAPEIEIEKKRFFSQIPELLEKTNLILSDPESFSCYPGNFAYTSWPYLTGDGNLSFGQLVLGWREGVLRDQCKRCSGVLYIYRFAGSPLSDRNSFSGYCVSCQAQVKDRSTQSIFIWRMCFVKTYKIGAWKFEH